MNIHDATPEAALIAIRAFKGPLLLDLDETLYLRNSTEDFIDTARPAAVAVLLLRLLDLIRPWRWTSGAVTRDVWRVRLVTLLFPWTDRRWRRLVPELAKRHANGPLVMALRDHDWPATVVTMGFRSIVTPLIAALELGESGIVAASSSTCADRLRGKLGMVSDALGADVVRRGLVLTDSIDDLPLLNACAKPLRTLWPGARFRAALSDVYLPGLYITRIKHPGQSYIRRGILQEDFAFWLLGSIALAAYPPLHALGLLALLLSFWTIYECGYVDNDRIAERYEKDPKLSLAFHTAPQSTATWEPWAWALASGALAIALLRWPAMPTEIDGVKWLLVLLGTHLWFLFYNRVDKQTRVWLYAGLQVARTSAFVVLVPIAVPGMLALCAHVLARWLPYYVYRFGGKDWPETPLALTRLLFFVVMAFLLTLTHGYEILISWTALALLAWNVFRARVELKTAICAAHRIDRTPR